MNGPRGNSNIYFRWHAERNLENICVRKYGKDFHEFFLADTKYNIIHIFFVFKHLFSPTCRRDQDRGGGIDLRN
jgi:hypothetical protein